QGLNDTYKNYIKQAYASDISGANRARVTLRLAELSIDDEDYEHALELGREALDSLEGEKKPLLVMQTISSVMVDATSRLALKAEDEKRADDLAAYNQQIEGYLRQLVELDLKHLTWADLEK